MIRPGGLLATMGALLALTAAPAGARVLHPLYEWHPEAVSGPQVLIQEKVDLSGKFDEKCGSVWIYTSFGGGGAADPFKLTGETLSGSEDFPTNTAGYGSSPRSAEVNFFDFHNAGPLDFTLAGTATEQKAVGTLTLHLYKLVKIKHPARHRPKVKKVLQVGCVVPFEAPDYYYEPPAAPESPPPETGE